MGNGIKYTVPCTALSANWWKTPDKKKFHQCVDFKIRFIHAVCISIEPFECLQNGGQAERNRCDLCFEFWVWLMSYLISLRGLDLRPILHPPPLGDWDILSVVKSPSWMSPGITWVLLADQIANNYFIKVVEIPIKGRERAPWVLKWPAW